LPYFGLSDDGEKAEILADFFSSVFTIENDDDETLLENIQYDEHSNNDNFTLTEVNKLLTELNTTKCCKVVDLPTMKPNCFILDKSNLSIC
jgi:uncharacterized protein Veg